MLPAGPPAPCGATGRAGRATGRSDRGTTCAPRNCPKSVRSSYVGLRSMQQGAGQQGAGRSLQGSSLQGAVCRAQSEGSSLQGAVCRAQSAGQQGAVCRAQSAGRGRQDARGAAPTSSRRGRHSVRGTSYAVARPLERTSRRGANPSDAVPPRLGVPRTRPARRARERTRMDFDPRPADRYCFHLCLG